MVTGAELEKLAEPIKVYNLEVADFNTYFVGDEAVLVHNYPDGDSVTNQPDISIDSDDPFDNSVPTLNRKSTGRVEPNNFNEQVAMQGVKSDPLNGAKRLFDITDPTWSEAGWAKYARNIGFSDGSKIEIHFIYNSILDAFDDFKFK